MARCSVWWQLPMVVLTWLSGRLFHSTVVECVLVLLSVHLNSYVVLVVQWLGLGPYHLSPGMVYPRRPYRLWWVLTLNLNRTTTTCIVRPLRLLVSESYSGKTFSALRGRSIDRAEQGTTSILTLKWLILLGSVAQWLALQLVRRRLLDPILTGIL